MVCKDTTHHNGREDPKSKEIKIKKEIKSEKPEIVRRKNDERGRGDRARQSRKEQQQQRNNPAGCSQRREWVRGGRQALAMNVMAT